MLYILYRFPFTIYIKSDNELQWDVVIKIICIEWDLHIQCTKKKRMNKKGVANYNDKKKMAITIILLQLHSSKVIIIKFQLQSSLYSVR